MNEKLSLSRRGFIKAAAVAGAAAGTFSLDSAFAMPTETPKTWDYTADVIVIGAGAAGLSAAVEAVEKGLSVIVMEKEPIVGGSSIICGGALSFAGTDLQEKAGIKDSNEIFFKDLMDVGLHVNNPEVVKSFLSVQLEVYNWLRDKGVHFANPIANGGTVKRRVDVKPPEVIKALLDYAKGKGAKIMLNTSAERLAYDDKAKKICGVIGKVRNKPASFLAIKGVLLAAGGFDRNKNMLEQYAPSMKKVRVMGGLGNVGDGIKMGMAYGADIIDTPYIKATFGFTTQNPTTMSDYIHYDYNGGIILNKQGKRIVNESISYKLLGDAVLAQEDGVGYQFFDEKVHQVLVNKDPAFAEQLEKRPGVLFKADTIKEVASLAGIDPEATELEVKKYNEYTEKGVDTEFGREYLIGKIGKPFKLETPPYYIFPSTAVILATYCGLKVTPQTEVLDVFGEKIPGLYAAGEMTGGFHGGAYYNGTSFGKSLVFGRIAVRSMVKS